MLFREAQTIEVSVFLPLGQRAFALNLTEKCDTSQATLSDFDWLGDQYSLPARAED